MSGPISISNTTRNAEAWQSQISGSGRMAESLPGATLRTGVSANALINSQQMFKDFFQTEVGKIQGSIGGPMAAGFAEIAESGLKAIMDKTFSAATDEFLKSGKISDPVGMMRTAHSEAIEVLGTLRMVASDIEETRSGDGAKTSVPQLVQGSDGYNLIRSAPKLENIVLKGGGAKGIGYPGALDEMKKSGMLDGLKRVAGTSAGALTAVSLAMGQDSKEFEALSKQNMMGLMFGGQELKANYPELGYKNGISKMEALPMLQLLDQISTKEITSFVGSLTPDELSKRVDNVVANSQMTKSEVLDRLAVLSNPDFTSDRTGKMVTFNDMKMLHQLEPSKFKELALTGWDSQTQKPIVFRADARYGDLPIIFAARASMAHPAIATGVTLPEKYGHGNHAIQDGGIGSNTPSEVFYNDDRDAAAMDTTGRTDLQDIRARTAVLIFEENGSAYRSLHDPEARKMEVKDASFVERLVAHNDNLGLDGRYDELKQYGAGPNAFVVAHGTVSTVTGLLSTDATKETAIKKSRDLMLDQIAQRQGQAYALSVDSPTTAYQMLDKTERRAVFDAGPPVLTNSMTDMNYRAAMDLYALAQAEFRPTPQPGSSDAVIIKT